MRCSKEDNDKNEIKQKIVTAALTLFMERGIKEVKMDDIASFISVSKRTIYELFDDKEVLIAESLKHHQKIMKRRAGEIIRKATDTFDVILQLYGLYFEQIKNTNRNFFTDLDRYPELHTRRKKRDKSNSKRFIAWMEKGRKEGFFREDADFQILAYILKRDLELIMTTAKQGKESELSRYTPEELGRLLIIFYLRGIATSKGEEKIEQFLKKD